MKNNFLQFNVLARALACAVFFAASLGFFSNATAADLKKVGRELAIYFEFKNILAEITDTDSDELDEDTSLQLPGSPQQVAMLLVTRLGTQEDSKISMIDFDVQEFGNSIAKNCADTSRVVYTPMCLFDSLKESL
jgi:hypothetical protein